MKLLFQTKKKIDIEVNPAFSSRADLNIKKKYILKMAAIDNKIHSIVTICLIGVITQIMHLKSLIVLYKLQKLKFDNFYKIIILSKRSRSLLKMKQARERRLKRKNRSCWFKNGRTDLWWQTFTTGVDPSDVWKKNFRPPRPFHFILSSNYYFFIC